ncbi:MAG: glycine betaine/L-proline ABC transporter ATP-binding protein [Firmicutes bacterium]|nr:glycine betaine/L-proline ABC transporter ATP-binding protein [Bacillota bacterium]
MTVKVKVEHLTKIFGPNPQPVLEKIKNGFTKNEILEETGHTVGVYDVSFEVKEGETFVIMGLSGSGKSTLIRCLNLLNKPTEGNIFIDDTNIVKLAKKDLKQVRQQKLAMVFQHFGLLTHRNVIKNVEYGLEIRGVSTEERQDIANKILISVGLEGWENKMISELSGGMQQRVGLARALANDPDVLLMDEPFSALDPLIRREMQYELLDIQSKLKKTIIFITHDVNEAFKIGDRVAVMKDGRMEQIGTPEEIIAEPQSTYIEEFIKDIDRSKVLQAKNIMFKSSALVSLKDGPRVAVKIMESNGISSVFVVDEELRLQGIVTIDDTIIAIKENKKIADILRQDYYTADPETYMQDLLPMATNTKFPLAVTDENNKLLGIIVRVSVLSGLV